MSKPFGIAHHSNKVPTDPTPTDFYGSGVLSEKNHIQILKYAFDPELWKTIFKENENRPPLKRAMRILVQIGTIDACLRGKYFVLSHQSQNQTNNDNNNQNDTTLEPSFTIHAVTLNKKDLDNAAKNSRMYSSDYKYNASKWKDNHFTTDITVTQGWMLSIHVHVKGDCLQVAIEWKNTKGANPVLLNMASMSHPGGGYRNGSGAQEENLTRRTNLFQCLEDPYQTDKGRKWTYPLPEFGGIYSPGVTVIRGQESEGYPFLESPEKISIVSVAAYSNPPVEQLKDGTVRISGKLVNMTKKKIAGMFKIALENGHDSIVLSAWGCGAYGNPPLHIFKEVIKQEFPDAFKYIVFAIIEDQNSHQDHNPQGNFAPFMQVFKIKPPAIQEEASNSNNNEVEHIQQQLDQLTVTQEYTDPSS